MFVQRRELRECAARFSRGGLVTACVVSGGLAIARPAAAQMRLDLGGGWEVGGEGERYARALELAGLVPLAPWSIQPFVASQAALMRPDSAHPWQQRFDAPTDPSVLRFSLLRPRARVVENSTFPVQEDIGPTWSGRGLTGELQAGVAANWRFIHFQLAPLAFSAQNADFTIVNNGLHDARMYGDARFAPFIDLPQRFGNSTYSRVTLGTSFLYLDGKYVAAGLTTAPQRWGPARDYPLLLGPASGGFPAFFAGTGRPLDLWLFKVGVRTLYGQLGQSRYTLPVRGSTKRLGAGIVGFVQPRGLPGLELGATRFIHDAWLGDSMSVSQALRLPFSGGVNVTTYSPNTRNNQMASLFFRWAVPAARAEFYGEMYREDFPQPFHTGYSWVEKPDDLASIMLGFQRVLHVNGESMRVLHAEIVNGETSHQERGARGGDFSQPQPPYIHTVMLQGHTNYGLPLGSAEAYGGAAWNIGVDDYDASGRRSLTLERALRFDWLPTRTDTSRVHPDVVFSTRAEVMRMMGNRDYTFTLIPAVDLNRDLEYRHDVFNLTAAVSVRGW